MKIKIKSREEIEKTLNESSFHIDMSGAYFLDLMFSECGKIIESNPLSCLGYSARTESAFSPSGWWIWHSDWYEAIEDFTKEDNYIIQELNEMLTYFMENR